MGSNNEFENGRKIYTQQCIKNIRESVDYGTFVH